VVFSYIALVNIALVGKSSVTVQSGGGSFDVRNAVTWETIVLTDEMNNKFISVFKAVFKRVAGR